MESNLIRHSAVPGRNAACCYGSTSKESLAFIDHPPPSFCFTRAAPGPYPLDTLDREADYPALEFGSFHGTRHDDAKWHPASSFAPVWNRGDFTVWAPLTEPFGTECITISKEWMAACHFVHLADRPAFSGLRYPHRRRTTMAAPGFVSPFTTACDVLTPTPFPRYPRPHNGQLNSYIKFVWTGPEPCSAKGGSVVEQHNPSTNASAIESSASQTCCTKCVTYELDCNGQTRRNQVEATGTHHSMLNRQTIHESQLLAGPLLTDNPRMQPSHFGLMVTMDGIDRKLWAFCTWK